MSLIQKFAMFALLVASLGLSAQETASAQAPEPPAAGDGARSHAARPSADYVLGPEDVIQVTVWREPTLSGNLVVRPDGMVSVPLLGDVKAAGLTPMVLGQDLSAKLTKFIKDPLVTVTVVTVNSEKIYLVGEIAHPGPLMLTPGMTVLQAVSSAGGLTPYANEKHIYILRGKTGRQAKIPFNYKKAVKQGDEQGVTLAAGDTIVVP